MSVLNSYESLSSKSPQVDVQNALNNIVNALPGRITSDQRTGLVKLILDDLQAAKGNSRLRTKDRPLALSALKTLGRSDDAAKLIATEPCLEFLLSIADESQDVPRMIANALLLHAPGRTNFRQIGGGEFAFNLLSSTNDPTQLFIACRLMFLFAHDSSSAEFVGKLLDKSAILDVTISKMDFLIKKLHSDPMAKDALTDMFKYIYSMILHYSRAQSGKQTVMGEAWCDKFSVWVPPLLRAYSTLPSTMTPAVPFSPPTTHLVHCLLSVPVEPYESSWFPPRRSPSPPNSLTSRARSLFSGNKQPSSRQSSPSSSNGSGSERGGSNANAIDHVRKTYDLLNKSLEHYFPGACEVDAKEVIDRTVEEEVSLEELLPPLVLLLRKLAEENENARRRVKDWILPEDLDRTNPLEGRADLLGRLIRLLTSVHHSRLQNCCGELLFVICDSDSSTLSSQIGYGNAAGYLFNKNILSAPPPPPSRGASSSSSASTSSTAAHQQNINPITGTVDRPLPESGIEEMTEEEKEREAEKLFVLFDRLEKNGMGTNPIRQALHEGKLEKYKS